MERVFANFGFAYIVAAVFYFIITCVFNYGTPFSDELQKKQYANLRIIKTKSATQRMWAFIYGIAIAIIWMLLVPFS